MSPVKKKAMTFTNGHFSQDTPGFNSSCWSDNAMTQGPFHYHAQPLPETEHFPPAVLLLPSELWDKEGPEYHPPRCVCVLQAWWHPIYRWFHRMANIRGFSGPLGIQLNLAAVYGAYAGPSSHKWSLAFCLGAPMFPSTSWLLTEHDSMVEQYGPGRDNIYIFSGYKDHFISVWKGNFPT